MLCQFNCNRQSISKSSENAEKQYAVDIMMKKRKFWLFITSYEIKSNNMYKNHQLAKYCELNLLNIIKINISLSVNSLIFLKYLVEKYFCKGWNHFCVYLRVLFLLSK